MVDELLVAADLAGDRLADADDALADGLGVELLVEVTVSITSAGLIERNDAISTIA
jgi:hypothetical protein